MSQAKRHENAMRGVVYQMPGVDDVEVRRDEVYRQDAGGPLTMDVYYPPASKRGARSPVVVVVLGYSDVGLQTVMGCPFKEMVWSIEWARMLAASGTVAILYTNREPAADVHALLDYLRQHAAALGIDEDRIAVWAASGHVPLALSIAMEHREHLKAAVFCYGYMLDLDGATSVAQYQAVWQFAAPAAGRSVADMPATLPLFVARCGKDQFGVNDSLDAFVLGAVRANLPMTFVNHAEAPHAFDIFHDSETSREIIRQILGFLRCHLLG